MPFDSLKPGQKSTWIHGMDAFVALDKSKGDGHLKFSGELRTLLRNLTSYNGQILHDGRFFVKDSESTKVEAIQPP